MHDHIALTWLLMERFIGKITAYMSLIMDAIKLSFTENELHNLNYPFKTIPVVQEFACARKRFLTVDADIEQDEGVMVFYQNVELFNKNRKTICPAAKIIKR